MLTFTIDRNNHITAHSPSPPAQLNPEAARFRGVQELDRRAKPWPRPSLVEICNGLPGHKPVKKFINRNVAVSRIVAAVQSLTPNRGATGLRLMPQKTKGRKRAHRQPTAPARRRGKTGRVLKLLQRPGGATLKQLITATQWQAHSVRGFLSGALKKKMGLKIRSTKGSAGERRYSIQA